MKQRGTKPNEYGDYFLDRLSKILESYEPVGFYDLTYNFKDLKFLQ